MIIDGKAKVGEAKVFATPKEMQQDQEIKDLKKELKKATKVCHKLWGNIMHFWGPEGFNKVLNRLEPQGVAELHAALKMLDEKIRGDL